MDAISRRFVNPALFGGTDEPRSPVRQAILGREALKNYSQKRLVRSRNFVTAAERGACFRP